MEWAQGSGLINAPFREHTEQLQRMPLVIGAHEKENLIAPQWQLPR